MKKIFFLFLFISSLGFSQTNYKLHKTIEGDFDFFTSDNLGNIYCVKGNTLSKFNKDGKFLYKFSNKNFGNISFVDASNMLKVLVFYKDFAQAVFLDNTLSFNGEPLSFDKLGFLQSSLICESYNSGIWIYDPQTSALVKLNPAYEKQQQTANLNALLNIELQPNLMMEHDNKLFISNPASGILIFDVYGTYFKTIPLKNCTQFQVIGDWVYGRQGDNVKAYNLATTEEKQFVMPILGFKNFRLELGVLMLQTDKGIMVFLEQ